MLYELHGGPLDGTLVKNKSKELRDGTAVMYAGVLLRDKNDSENVILTAACTCCHPKRPKYLYRNRAGRFEFEKRMR